MGILEASGGVGEAESAGAETEGGRAGGEARGDVCAESAVEIQFAECEAGVSCAEGGFVWYVERSCGAIRCCFWRE